VPIVSFTGHVRRLVRSEAVLRLSLTGCHGRLHGRALRSTNLTTVIASDEEGHEADPGPK
jgi:hypothetical protein